MQLKGGTYSQFTALMLYWSCYCSHGSYIQWRIIRICCGWRELGNFTCLGHLFTSAVLWTEFLSVFFHTFWLAIWKKNHEKKIVSLISYSFSNIHFLFTHLVLKCCINSGNWAPTQHQHVWVEVMVCYLHMNQVPPPSI